ncbi:MAG: glycerol-3-phosphate acyltransferase [Clostridia bacterium]|nr:glycerol-3-phosphate acyltransferase [Clostridia bacterium]
MKELAFSQIWYWFIIIPVVCYFIGCFNFAVLISKFKKKDIRQMGSGNPGTMNMTREFGAKIGALTLLCDGCKGGIPLLIAYFGFKGYVFAGTEVAISDFMRYFTGVFVVLGHIYPVTMQFKGGKGIASTIGILVFGISCEVWWAVFIMVIVYGASVIGYILVTEWGSMGSLYAVSVGVVAQGIIFYVRYASCLTNGWVIGMMMCLFVIAFQTWFAHRTNIARLLSGEEHRTKVKKKS